MAVLWILVLLGGLIAGFQFFSVLLATEISAPQQAAGSAMAVAWIVIPYCFARACNELDPGRDLPAMRKQLAEVIDRLSTHTRLLAATANILNPVKPDVKITAEPLPPPALVPQPSPPKERDSTWIWVVIAALALAGVVIYWQRS